MDMTLNQYILNPMGKSNSVLNASTRELTKAQYRTKFDNILLRENGSIEYYLFHDNKNETYWAYFKIPSEVVPKFYYDVVFKFNANQSLGGTFDIFKYNVKFFSNDPAFVYTYAYVFKKNNLFIQELHSKMSKEALKKEAKEKNPKELVGYVKTIYFAYLVMQNRGLNKLIRFNAEAKPLDPEFLMKNIMNADDKISLRQEKGSKISKRKKIEIDQDTYTKLKPYIDKNTDTSRLAVTTTKRITAIKAKAPTKPVRKSKK